MTKRIKISEYTTYFLSGRYADWENTGEDRVNLERSSSYLEDSEVQASITKVKDRAKCNVQVDLREKGYDDEKR